MLGANMAQPGITRDGDVIFLRINRVLMLLFCQFKHSVEEYINRKRMRMKLYIWEEYNM